MEQPQENNINNNNNNNDDHNHNDNDKDKNNANQGDDDYVKNNNDVDAHVESNHNNHGSEALDSTTHDHHGAPCNDDNDGIDNNGKSVSVGSVIPNQNENDMKNETTGSVQLSAKNSSHSDNQKNEATPTHNSKDNEAISADKKKKKKKRKKKKKKVPASAEDKKDDSDDAGGGTKATSVSNSWAAMVKLTSQPTNPKINKVSPPSPLHVAIPFPTPASFKLKSPSSAETTNSGDSSATTASSSSVSSISKFTSRRNRKSQGPASDTTTKSTVEQKNVPSIRTSKKRQPIYLTDLLQTKATPKKTVVQSTDVSKSTLSRLLKSGKFVENANKGSSERFIEKRGKERETPKRKRKTKLKRIILAERQRLYEELLNDGSIDIVSKTVKEEKTDPIPAENVLTEKQKYQELKESLPQTKPLREYCDQVITNEVDTAASALIAELNRFQERMKQRDPQKAKAKKRIVFGLREVEKGCRRRKIKCALIAPNIDEINAPGGLDSMIEAILKECAAAAIPVVYVMNRNKLGKACGKKTRVSAVGIYDYDGANEQYKALLQAAQEAREEKVKIDKWIVENALNMYGDPQDTVYENGICPSCLYDQKTKRFLLDSYRYLLKRFEDKPWNSSKVDQSKKGKQIGDSTIK